MAKRKASTAPLLTEPPRRRLRSSGPVVETSLELTTKQPTGPGGAATPSKSRKIRGQASVGALTSAAKGNKARRDTNRKPSVPLPENPLTKIPRHIAKIDLGDESESDELNILPATPQSPRPPSTPSKHIPRREVMHSVTIVTPRHLSHAIGSPTGSPRPSSPRSMSGTKTTDMIRLVPGTPRVIPSSPKKRVLISQTTSPVSSPPQAAHITPHTEIESEVTIPVVSPSKKQPTDVQFHSPIRLSGTLPLHLHSCLHAQKKAILEALREPQELDEDLNDQDVPPSTNSIAYKDVCDLLAGTVNRGEGNSCLLIGPRGSGKTRLVDRSLEQVSDQISPIVIRLSGHAQLNDRMAMREIAWQLTLQTGNTFLSENEDEPEGEEEDPMSLPPPAHLPSLISVLPSQPRPVVVILDAFDCFALHGRQALLYCLLDTAQSCRVGEGNNGIAVIGVTSRVDTINLLEKRVKSRFSGRMFRTAGTSRWTDWASLTRRTFMAPIESEHANEWSELWGTSIDRFLNDRKVIDALQETFALSKDLRVLVRILTTVVLDLAPTSPFPSSRQLDASIAIQRFPVHFSYLSKLSYPSICLLISAIHSQTSGHDTFTFEMLYQAFRDQVRTSMSAPVQVEGGSIGMVKCGRHTLMGAFEQLANCKVFEPIVTPSITIAKEFVRYRCVVDRDDVKKAIEKIGQTNLKKWFAKSQQSG